jgi:multiple sugar transport system permease protein
MGQIQARPRQAAQAVSWRQSRAMQERLTRWVVRLVLILVGILFMLPFYWMISTSLKPDAQLAVFPPVWLPHPLVWSNYYDAVTEQPFFLYLQNTLIICAATVTGVVLSSSLCAYGFSRVPWRGRNVVFVLMLSTLMLPYQVTMIPLFIIFSKVFHWINTFLPLTVPAFFGDAFSIFLLRQFFMGIPRELTDAAVIDGANDWHIFTRVILPLAKPALAAVALFNFTGTWNDFLNPLIYLNDSSKFTLTLGLYSFLGDHSSQWQLLDASAALITIPPLVLFFFAQKTFIQGIALSGIKG